MLIRGADHPSPSFHSELDHPQMTLHNRARRRSRVKPTSSCWWLGYHDSLSGRRTSCISIYIYISNKNLGDPGSKDPKIVVSNFFWGSNDPKDYCVNFFWDQTIQRSLCPIFFGDQKRSKSLLCPIFFGGSKDPKIIVSNFCGSKDPKIFLCIPFFWGASLWTLSACWLPKPLVATFQEYGMLLELYRGLRQAICFYGCDLFDLSRDFSLDHMGLGFRQICYFKSQGPKSIQKLKAVKISSSLRFLWDVFFSCPASHCHLCHRIWSAPYGWCQISTLMSFEVGFPKCLRPCFGTSVVILGGTHFFNWEVIVYRLDKDGKNVCRIGKWTLQHWWFHSSKTNFPTHGQSEGSTLELRMFFPFWKGRWVFRFFCFSSKIVEMSGFNQRKQMIWRDLSCINCITGWNIGMYTCKPSITLLETEYR